MPNANTPFGLRPTKALSNNPYSGGVAQYATAAGDSTAIFIGDPVTITGASLFINGQVFPVAAQAASGGIIDGVVVGVLQDTRDSTIYRAASTQRILLVNTDPNAEFEVQQVSTGTPLTANDIGLNVDFVVGTGSTVTGMSGVTLNNTTEASTNTLDLKITGMVNRADNDPGTAVGTGEASSKFLVRINRHRFANQIAGA